MQYTLRSLLALTLLTLSALSASAEPTPAVRWLMNEPASLFDIGMMRLREVNKLSWTPAFLAEITKRNLNLTHYERSWLGGAVYSWDDNIISIDVSLLGAPTEVLCSTALGIYKDVISPNRESSRELAVLFLTHFFDHINYNSARRPKDLHENLANVLIFSVGISDSRDPITNSTIFCTSKLFDSVPTFKKYGRNR